ncbi:DEKNAAC102334 [Brettanomyces naardenensis]|uniref:NADH-cytochrome b5 reductase n=1 Tax=Brettanomyces naardenensis TaxID=13370 RepID=A0A448YLK1_BRENA|nr:DEKNAAC102334 [Brettanomyces naardenensis]
MLAILSLYFAYHYYRIKGQRPILSSDTFQPYELIDMTIVSKNTAIYRFKLDKEYETLSIPVGQHLACRFSIDDKDEIRYYTPISNQYDEGFFDIMVKSYPNGKVSKQFAGLQVGDKVDFKGPVGRISYEKNVADEIYMVAGGSGITPMLQVLAAIITTPEDLTKVSLLYANETENDILLKGELDELAQKYANFKVSYTLTHPPKNWDGKVGYVTKEMLKEFLPEPSGDRRVFVCGPMKMKEAILKYTEELGWEKGVLQSGGEDQVFCF